MHFQLFAPVSARVHGKALSLADYAVIIVEQYISNFALFSKVYSCWSYAFPALCSSERTCARESTFFIFIFFFILFLLSKTHFAANVFHKNIGIIGALKRNAHDQIEQTINYFRSLHCINEMFKINCLLTYQDQVKLCEQRLLGKYKRIW